MREGPLTRSPAAAFATRSPAAAFALVACTALIGACGGGGPAKTSTSTPKSAATSTAQAPPSGRQVFLASGCGGCHTLSAAGSQGRVGPNLDEALPGRSSAFIRESILHPDANVPPGYAAAIMPSDFGSRLSAAQLQALVSFLHRSAQGR